MINIRSIRNLKDGDGFTLKDGYKIRYKTGYQVADYGFETKDGHEAMRIIKLYKGNCGVWFENEIYYIDHSFRVKTKTESMRIAKAHNQISIYNWKKECCDYVKEYFGDV